MANSDHIERLSKGAKFWNAWRKENRGTIPDFEGAVFTLSQRQLGPVDKDPVNLQHANMQGAFLYYAQLTKAKLANSDLKGANLSYARMENTDLTAADLEGAVLDHANFQGANLSVAILNNTDLSKVSNLTQSQIDKAKGNRETLIPKHLTTPESWLVETTQKSERDESKPKQFVKGHTDNFYALLNVSPLATEQEIRSAYRKLAKVYHPDLNPDNPAIAEQFKLLTTVFEILSDPEKRAQYDSVIAENPADDAVQSELFS